MNRSWCLLWGVVLAISLLGCGESKLERMKRLAGVGNPDDPPGDPALVAATPPKEIEPAKPEAAPPPVAPPAPATTVAPPSTVVTTVPASVTPAANEQLPQPTVAVQRPPAVSTLTQPERRERTIKNLAAIAAALESYMQYSNSVPAPAFCDENTQAPLLSWRVAILKELGHAELYRQFHLAESWDSPHNLKLLQQIPPEYQSPDRLDEKTNYLFPIGTSVAMAPNSNRPFTQFNDGLQNTLLVVEVDDAHAVPWTKPADLPVNLDVPQTGLGSLREDGFFAILANATVRRVPKETTAEQVRALLTFAGGDGPKANEIVKDVITVAGGPVAGAPANPNANIPVAVVGTSLTSPDSNATAPESTNPLPPMAAAAKVDLPAITALLVTSSNQRIGVLPIPHEADLKLARDSLREVYAPDYARARTPQDRQKLAVQLLADAATLTRPAEQYECMRISRDLAIQIGDYATAQKSLQALEKTFDINVLALRAKTLADLQQPAGRSGQLGALQGEAQSLVIAGIQQNQFDVANTALDVMVACYRAQQNKQALNSTEFLRQYIEAAKIAYEEVPGALSTLAQQPTDPQACDTIGKYLCLVRCRWDLGLPLLLQSEDIRLKFVATIDLEPNKTPKTLVQLGDSYWQLADEFKTSQRAAMQVRAYSCYQQAMPHFTSGIERIKLQKRIAELENGIGRETIERMLAADPAFVKSMPPAND
ncbi:hypothetical protein ETAA8_59090 [Anatilimnocola aggregata]|uniref:DUF1559 domain-containing protein n=1 Tax=Anatilimnocola aggregata TaxID=2528021 RepID=A0A517YKJ9_9BACT|nr:DUF1559 domain-containing protein [Anatilimnocola aggregata]QDU30761.1 hypothetical protein ETAA8_59090 [Anatilimnocola aggregata]